jgi:hypothetical protein
VRDRVSALATAAATPSLTSSEIMMSLLSGTLSIYRTESRGQKSESRALPQRPQLEWQVVVFNAGMAKSSLRVCKFEAGGDFQTEPLKQDGLMVCGAESPRHDKLRPSG